MLTIYPVLLAFFATSTTASLPPPHQRLGIPRRPSSTSDVAQNDLNVARSLMSTQFTVPKFSNPKAAASRVNSSALPLVTFPLQDSWAGHLPVTANQTEDKKLFYWYWPSSAKNGSDTLTIWLNGGPGCSSLGGFLSENGPVQFSGNESAPVPNPYAWTTLSDMLYIDQPIGTGFSRGTPDITNDFQMADEFYGFLTQFFAVYPELLKKKFRITGESFAGDYIPFITNRIFNASSIEKHTTPLQLDGIMINDGSLSSILNMQEIPMARYAQTHQAALNLTDFQIAQLFNQSRTCGYEAVMDQVTYPRRGQIDLPNGNQEILHDACDVQGTAAIWASASNPCLNAYRVTDKCPTPPEITNPYFSRPDVQSLLHIPPNFGNFSQCSADPYSVYINHTDNSPHSYTLLPEILTRIPVWIWHGLEDPLLLNDGDRIMIQNLTWNGLQGFQQAPTTPLVVGSKTTGIRHSERNLTYIEVTDAGHMIPADAPVTALHVFKAFLGAGRL